MAALVLLNGPPGVGKSTLARRVAADHPLALALDIDVVRSMLGRWIDTPTDAGLAARALAVAMIRTHLAAGHDVVVPQFLGRVDFVVELAAVAAGAGVPFVELALTAGRDDAAAWLAERTRHPVTVVDRENAELVARRGDGPGRDVRRLPRRGGRPSGHDRGAGRAR